MPEGTGFPALRQRAEQLHPVSFAGEQHFAHSGRPAHIPVDLEDARRMQIEQRFRSEITDQRRQVFPAVLCASQPCHETGNPCPAPAGVSAAVGQAGIERAFACLPKRIPLREEISRIETVQMAQVTVARFDFDPLPVKFIEAAL